MSNESDITVGFDIRKYFFDPVELLEKKERGEELALSKGLAYIRRRARSSLRRRKGPSKVGTPPSVHSNSPFATFRNILFGMIEPGRGIVGPVRIRTNKGHLPSSLVPPQAQEFGAETVTTKAVVIRNAVGRDASGGFTSQGTRRIEAGTTVVLPPRPTMGPALEKEAAAGTLPVAFRGVVANG